jgi:histidinol-phosphatase
MEDQELLQAAIEIATEAGSLAARLFLEGVPVRLKPDGSPVTPADFQVEQLTRSLIASRFPGDGVLGEEDGETAGHSGRRWVIDPIDGTTYFSQRIPTFEVLLAIEDERGCAAAVIGCPMSRELYYAGRGLGAWHKIERRHAERLTVNDKRRRRGAWVEANNPAGWSEELLMTLHREVMLVPNMRGFASVASGFIDAVICAGLPMQYWDVAARELLLTEAGGRLTDLEGNDIRTGNGTVLGSNGHLHDALLELVQGLPANRDWQALIDGT